jgi:hypothetical protein
MADRVDLIPRQPPGRKDALDLSGRLIWEGCPPGADEVAKLAEAEQLRKLARAASAARPDASCTDILMRATRLATVAARLELPFAGWAPVPDRPTLVRPPGQESVWLLEPAAYMRAPLPAPPRVIEELLEVERVLRHNAVGFDELVVAHELPPERGRPRPRRVAVGRTAAAVGRAVLLGAAAAVALPLLPVIGLIALLAQGPDPALYGVLRDPTSQWGYWWLLASWDEEAP